jgi:predicted phage terminase large subunit-like protein
MVATPWSVHDPMNRVERMHSDNPRCKVIKKPCYDENGESAFNFQGGFSTKYYRELEETMDSASFSALYLQEPIEREGILIHEEDLEYYFDLPEGEPDAIVSVCDSKNLGKDFVSAPVGYIYGEDVYIEDVVFNNGLPDVTRPLVANCWIRNHVKMGAVEMNNGGNYYAEYLDTLIKQGGGRTSIRTFFSSNNKNVKIITNADYVKRHFKFKHKSTYAKTSEYATFMKWLLKWSQTGKNEFDDAPDSVAMLAEFIQTLVGNKVQILDRRSLRI